MTEAMTTLDGKRLTAHYQPGPLVYVFGRNEVIDLTKPDAMQLLGAAGDPWEMDQNGTGIVNYWYDGSERDVSEERDPYRLKAIGDKIHREYSKRSRQEGLEEEQQAAKHVKVTMPRKSL